MAKDCKVTLKCKECESDKHTSEMHPGLAPWLLGEQTEHTPEDEQNGEREEQTPPVVTSKCTEIYGGAPKPRSCSKILLG